LQFMSLDLINIAINKGGKIYASISGGKDGDAMVETLVKNGYSIAGLVHADLGRVEWPESLPQCLKCSDKFGIPLHVVTRTDGADMLQHWQNRLEKVRGTGKPFWSSKSNRYCTSDLKRDPINRFYTSTGDTLIINCEGIRAQESDDRAAREPLTIRWRKTSNYYTYKASDIESRKSVEIPMTVEEALEVYDPRYKLALDWYPIFNYSVADVWATMGLTPEDLIAARMIYSITGVVPSWWTFHPAYAYGNDRVSCMFCIMGTVNDLGNAAVHNPGLLDEMIAMEIDGNATFQGKKSLSVFKI